MKNNIFPIRERTIEFFEENKEYEFYVRVKNTSKTVKIIFVEK